MNTIIKKGLTGFHLKYFALIFMVFDHIHYFFEYTQKIPVWFSMLGRLAAPLFLFTMVEGYIHTTNRKKYFLRMFFISIIMSSIQYFMAIGFWNRRDGFFPRNQVFSNFILLVILFYGIDLWKQKKYIKGFFAIFIPFFLPYLLVIGFSQLPMESTITQGIWQILNLLHFTIFPFHFWIIDGGTIFLLEGIILYLFHKNKKRQITLFAIVHFLYYGVYVFIITGYNLHTWFFEAYEWMGIFAIFFMLLYNGEKGNGNKTFFYLFYPAHIYILYILSCIFI